MLQERSLVFCQLNLFLKELARVVNLDDNTFFLCVNLLRGGSFTDNGRFLNFKFTLSLSCRVPAADELGIGHAGESEHQRD